MKRATLLDAVNAVTSISTVWYDLGEEKSFGLVASLTGVNVSGTFSLEASVGSDNPNTDGSAIYATVPNSSQTVTNSDDVIYNVDGAGYRWVRLKWVYISGAGTLTAKIEVKETASTR